MTNLPSLKRISSRDSKTFRDYRSYNKIFLLWFNIPLYLKVFLKLFYKILEFNTQNDQHSTRYFTKTKYYQSMIFLSHSRILRMAWQGLTQSINIGFDNMVIKNKSKVFSSTKHKYGKINKSYT